MLLQLKIECESDIGNFTYCIKNNWKLTYLNALEFPDILYLKTKIDY